MGTDFAKIKSLRMQQGLTKEQAAKKAGFRTAQQWHDIEIGRFPDPRVSTLEKIAKALQVKVRDLLE